MAAMRTDSADGIPRGTPITGLDGLLMHPAIWRGRSLAPIDTHATGCARLDEALPLAAAVAEEEVAV
jgi:hypothetical protein